MKSSYRALEKRERAAAALGAAAVLAFLLLRLVFLPLADKRESLRAFIEAGERDLAELRALVREYKAMRPETDGDAAAGENFNLFSLLERTAGECGMIDKLDYMRPGSTDLDASRKEDWVEVKLSRVTLRELVEYLYRIRSPGTGIYVKRLSARKDGDYLNVVLQPAAARPKEGMLSGPPLSHRKKGANGSERPLDYYKPVWERNLFSVKAREDEEDEARRLLEQIDELSLTSLDCTLVGTFVHDGGNSRAIIKDNRSGKQERHTVGSTVRGAEIVMILRNKVVLDINGKKELLVMGIEKIRAEGGGPETATGTAGGGVETYKVSREFMRRSINNAAEIMAGVRIEPFFEDGKPAGFRVSEIRQGSILKTMGFEDGDIIKSVNGHEIRTARDLMTLYGSLKDRDFFGIGLIRDNQKKTLNFKVR